MNLEDGQSHNLDDMREEEFAGVLRLSVLLEGAVEFLRVKGSKQKQAKQDGYGSVLNEAFENLAEQHR